ncbi:unnamed protein product [Umbelopsis vinacea]
MISTQTICLLLVLATGLSTVYGAPVESVAQFPPLPAENEKPLCVSVHHDFSTLQTLPPQWAHVWGEYTLGHDGLGLKLTAPSNYKVVHKNGEMFNNNLGLGASINSTHYMKYGTVKAVVKTSPVAGAITAIIAISPTGDEIDLEWVGGDGLRVQSNYFYGTDAVYGLNGGYHNVAGIAVDKGFHEYAFTWTPDRIQWFIDGQLIRTKEKIETCDANAFCKFPVRPSLIQLGIWDGSHEHQDWSYGPINWDSNKETYAYVKSVTIECNPEYNTIV